MRIIAGQFRGRPLRAPKGMKTRPTTDRVREALFSILGNVEGLRVLDCYAGTGALGLEALSRGAAFAIFIESGKEAARVIESNIRTLGVEARSLILRCPVERATSALAKQAALDLILADPPWPICHSAAPEVAKLALDKLSEQGVMVLGHPTSKPVELEGNLARSFELQQRRRWGDSAMSFYERFQGAQSHSNPVTET